MRPDPLKKRAARQLRQAADLLNIVMQSKGETHSSVVSTIAEDLATADQLDGPAAPSPPAPPAPQTPLEMAMKNYYPYRGGFPKPS